MRIWGVLVSMGLSLCPPVSAQKVWSEFTTPAAGNPESIGFYSNGCLRGVIDLPPEGDGCLEITLQSKTDNHFAEELIDPALARTLEAPRSGIDPLPASCLKVMEE